MSEDSERLTKCSFSHEELPDIELAMIFSSLDSGPEVPAPPEGLASRVRLLRVLFELEDKIEEAQTESQEFVQKEIERFEQENMEKWEVPEYLTENLEDIFKEAEVIRQVSSHVFLTVTIINEMISHFSVEILKKELIDEEYEKSSKTQNLLAKRMNQGDREDLLLRTGTISEGLKSEMSHIRDFRNKLVHDVENRVVFYHTSNLLSEVNRGIEALNSVHEILNGKPLLPDYQEIKL